MSAELFRLVILGMYAVGIAIAAYYEGKTKGFLEGYDSGWSESEQPKFCPNCGMRVVEVSE